MAKTFNNVKINTEFTTATTREQLTSGENLCTSLGKVNKYLADLDAGAFTFPANGGNADTVDNKHANEFMQFLGALSTGSLLDYVLTMTNSGYLLVRSGVTDTPVSGQFFFVDVRRDASGSYAITAARFNAGGVWTNRYNASNKKWYGWANVADGGNADTVDGKHAADFSQIISFGDTPTDTKTAIGIQYKTTTYRCVHWTDYPASLQDGQGMIIAVNYKGSGTTGTDNIWCRQIYINPHNSKIYQRIINKTTVGEWTNIADGGNAASVGAYTESAIAALEARIAALEGK